MDTLCDNLVNVPIVVSDWDAMTANRPTSSTTSPTTDRSTPAIGATTASSASSTTTSAHNQKWGTGFTEFADELWTKMTTGMKQKLREACVEVLKRTDDPSEEEKISWLYDEDARFLD